MNEILTTKQLETILADDKSIKLISRIMTLRQQERFLNSEKERLKNEARKLEHEIIVKHKVHFIGVSILISELEKKGLIGIKSI